MGTLLELCSSYGPSNVSFVACLRPNIAALKGLTAKFFQCTESSDDVLSHLAQLDR